MSDVIYEEVGLHHHTEEKIGISNSDIFSPYILRKGGIHLKKKTVFFGNFSQMVDPPPFWEPLS